MAEPAVNKAARIRAYLAQGLTPQEIAPLIPCLDAYVRLVRQDFANQRKWNRELRRKDPEKACRLNTAKAARRAHRDPARYHLSNRLGWQRRKRAREQAEA